MPIMTAGWIKARGLIIEKEIARLARCLAKEKAELKELQKKCPHPSLKRTATWRRDVSFCPDCGFYESFKD